MDVLFGALVIGGFILTFVSGLKSDTEDESSAVPERHVDARSIDPAETYHKVMDAIDEVQGRWLGGRYGDEVVHLHLPRRAEIARHDSDLRRSLRWLEEEAGSVDVVLHYENEPSIDRRVSRQPAPRTAGATAPVSGRSVPRTSRLQVKENYHGWDKAVVDGGKVLRGEYRQKETVGEFMPLVMTTGTALGIVALVVLLVSLF